MKIERYKLKLFGLTAVVGLLFPLMSFADEELPDIDLTIARVFEILTRLSCYAVRIVIPIMVIVVLWYGWSMIASRDPDALGKARNNLKWGFIGILVILGTYTIIATVAAAAGVSDFSFVNILRQRCGL